MALTDAAIRNAKPRDKVVRMFDALGLYLELSPKGAKLWRWKYRHQGKEKRLALGVYPEVSLLRARESCAEARDLLRAGTDPGHARKAAKTATDAGVSFETVAREWHDKHANLWAKSYAPGVLRRFERDVFPWIGAVPIAELTAPAVLAMLRRIEERGAVETAHRALTCCGQVMRYAVATSRADRDPCADLRGALPPTAPTHFPAITEPDQVAELLRAFDGYQGGLVVASALRLAPLVFVRPGELRTALWADIDLDAGRWTFMASKTATAMVVPLSKQAVAILRDLKPLTGRGRYVFPSARTAFRPMSDNAVLAALRRLGISKDVMTGHGFRAMARTILDEVLHFPAELIEQQLGHAVRDPLGRAYNRTTRLPERVAMMQRWADYLDELKPTRPKLLADPTPAAMEEPCPSYRSKTTSSLSLPPSVRSVSTITRSPRSKASRSSPRRTSVA
jgi:integrase